jgi:GMP synthase-like glutamine amidotransferase
MQNAIAIRHVAFEDAGTLEGVLEDRGIALNYLEAGVDDLSPAQDADLLVLVMLGGPIGIYEIDRYPFIKGELAIIEAAVKKNVPVIGICLGCQALAAVLALQFHVELPQRDLEKWLIGHTLELSNSKVDLAQLRAETSRCAPAANEASRKLFNDWLDGVAAS